MVEVSCAGSGAGLHPPGSLPVQDILWNQGPGRFQQVYKITLLSNFSWKYNPVLNTGRSSLTELLIHCLNGKEMSCLAQTAEGCESRPHLLRAGHRRDSLDTSLAAPAFHSPPGTRHSSTVWCCPEDWGAKSSPDPRNSIHSCGNLSSLLLSSPLQGLSKASSSQTPGALRSLEMKIIFLVLKLDQISHFESLLVKLTAQ